MLLKITFVDRAEHLMTGHTKLEDAEDVTSQELDVVEVLSLV